MGAVSPLPQKSAVRCLSPSVVITNALEKYSRYNDNCVTDLLDSIGKESESTEKSQAWIQARSPERFQDHQNMLC